MLIYFIIFISFKERGALNTLILLSQEQKRTGVISASLGNHAQGLCYHGYRLGIPVTVVMPILAPIMKIQKCRDYNATVIVQGQNMSQAKNIAMRLSEEKGLMYVNGSVSFSLMVFYVNDNIERYLYTTIRLPLAS